MKYKSIAVLFLLLFLPLMVVRSQSDTVYNQTDVNGLKQGWWKKDYSNGKIMYKGFFKDDHPVGEMRRYFETGGLLAKLDYDSAGKHARATLYYQDGQVAAAGNYVNELKDSTWAYYSYYGHSLTMKEDFQKGVRNGMEIHYYNDGTVSEKVQWKNDRKEGIWEQYFTSSILKLKGTYRDNKLNGDFYVNHENGEPFISGKYVNDLREGNWTFYNEDGSLDMVLNYQNGKTSDEKILNDKQEELFRMIDENQGKYEEPDETNFLTPQRR